MEAVSRLLRKESPDSLSHSTWSRIDTHRMTDDQPESDEVSGLVQAAKSNRQAFGQLFNRFYSHIFAYCSRRLLLSAVAEDVTSEVFLKVAGQIAKFPGTTAEDFRRWLFRIATNEINAHLRQTIRRRELLEAAVELGQVDASACIVLLDDDSPVDWEEVYRAIGQLSETEQSIISLRFFGGLRHDQIAEVLNLSSTSIRKTLSRSLAKLRERIQGVEHTPMGSQPSQDGESGNE